MHSDNYGKHSEMEGHLTEHRGQMQYIYNYNLKVFLLKGITEEERL